MDQNPTASRHGGQHTCVGNKRDWIMLKEAWLMAIAADPRLPPWASAVGIVLASHFNRRDGKAFLGFGRLVGLVGGAQERTVQRSLAAMQKVGLLDREGGSPGRTTRYRIADAFVEQWKNSAMPASERVSPQTDWVSPETERVSLQTPGTSDRTFDQTSDATTYDAPRGALENLEMLIGDVRRAAGVLPPFSIHWTNERVERALIYWIQELHLDTDAVLGCIRELRCIRLGVSFNAPAYFDGRMRDIAARRDPVRGAPVTAEDHLAAVVGREAAADFVELREERGEPLDPSEAVFIADQLRTYDDPIRAMWGVLSAGGSVPIEYGVFGRR